jgi:hypothetical protein
MNQSLSRREVLRASAAAVAAGGLALAACNEGGQGSGASDVSAVANEGSPPPSATVEQRTHPLIRDGKVMVVPGVYDVWPHCYETPAGIALRSILRYPP